MKNRESKLDSPFFIVTGALFVGVVYLVLHQVGRPLWLDDTHSTYHAFNGPFAVIQNLRTDSHPPLYFFFLSIWMGLVGLGEVALRLPSIFFYLLAGLVLFVFGSRIEGRSVGTRKIGVLFALFYLFNPIAVQHSHGVRMYSLLGLFSAVSTTLFLRLADQDRGGKRWVLYTFILSNVLGTFTHYWFFLLLTGQAVGSAFFSKGSARVRVIMSLVASVVPFAVLWSPVLLEQMRGNPTGWMGVPGGFWLASVPLQLLGGWDQWDYTGPARIFYFLLAATCLVRFRHGRLGLVPIDELVEFLRDRTVRLLAVIPVAVMVLAFSLSQIRPVYHVKYTIVAIPAFAMFLGLVLSRLGERRLVPLLAMIFLGGSCLLRADSLTGEHERDDRATAEYLIENYQVGDEVVHVTLNFAPITHYLRALAPGRTFSQTVFPQEVASHVGWRDGEQMVQDTSSLRREAEGIAKALSRRPDLGRLWLLPVLSTDGASELRPDSVITGILIEEIERAFLLEKTVPIRGWWHREIQVYVPR